jgi:hypothetical protein
MDVIWQGRGVAMTIQSTIAFFPAVNFLNIATTTKILVGSDGKFFTVLNP